SIAPSDAKSARRIERLRSLLCVGRPAHTRPTFFVAAYGASRARHFSRACELADAYGIDVGIVSGLVRMIRPRLIRGANRLYGGTISPGAIPSATPRTVQRSDFRSICAATITRAPASAMIGAYLTNWMTSP